jgi:hypothetical protein
VKSHHLFVFFASTSAFQPDANYLATREKRIEEEHTGEIQMNDILVAIG